MTQERLQKILSRAGLGSRREMETWIQAGQVKVNGKVAQLGDSAIATDRIHVKGRLLRNPLRQAFRRRVVIYHKPVGEISSRKDPKHNKTVFDHLPLLKKGRWVQVGRLDINTSGLMIFTNDGELAHQLMHPKFSIEREYAVRLHGQVCGDAVQNLLNGVTIDDQVAKFNSITFQGGEGSNSWYHVVLTEGRNREVRKLWESQGVQVSRLTRIRFGDLTLPRYLPRGQHKELNTDEIQRYFGKILNASL